MNVTRIPAINFMGKIIDSHAHLGNHGDKLYTKEQLDVFIKTPLKNNDTVEKFIISDLDVLHGLKPEFEGNKNLAEMLKGNKNYTLLASCNPKTGDVKNIKQLFKKYPNEFMGLKFHSDIQQLALSDKKYEPYMEFATKNNLPCLFHSQVNTINGKLNPNSIHISVSVFLCSS